MHHAFPPLKKDAIPVTHFPTRHQAFIFRASEYFPVAKIASLLKTSVENVKAAQSEMGVPDYQPDERWIRRGYITIIRNMWHILPYDQLLELLDMSEDELGVILKEEDFLSHKLFEKPICDRVEWRELTEEEKARTAEIKELIRDVKIEGKRPFEFEYPKTKVKLSGKELFDTRMIYPFAGLYQQAFDVDSEVFLPDEQLIAYQNLGVNGLWMQGVLSQLAYYPFDPKLSEGYEKRVEKMQAMVERLKKFGLKLFLYINEPRFMPLSFFEKHPELRGHVRGDAASLCTSTEVVQNYIKDSIESICRAVPDIGGFFTITRSENHTNCYSHSGGDRGECNCPRCKNRTPGDVIGELMGCIVEGAHRVSDKIKIFAWNWSWSEFSEEIIRKLPKEVVLFSNSEKAIPFTIGGISGTVSDYSMSIVGPGEPAKLDWKIAKECGLEVGAKVQINTTWEASTTPAIPVSPLVEQHMEGIQKEGVRHVMLSWTLGGYPSTNIAAAAKYFFEKYERDDFDPELYEAEKQFSIAFKEFPFHKDLLYTGPQNAGPSVLLYEKNTGYQATMTCFPYDHIMAWSAYFYPFDVMENQFKLLTEKWEIGLNMLKEDDERETAIMAHAAYCLFKSSYNLIRFVRARDDERYADAVEAAKGELVIAKKMLSLMNKNASIGYEAANHYYFSRGQVVEKIINCDYIIKKFEKLIKQ